jgi:F0F1-type ATP synthase membrane subunit b/b'
MDTAIKLLKDFAKFTRTIIDLNNNRLRSISADITEMRNSNKEVSNVLAEIQQKLDELEEPEDVQH